MKLGNLSFAISILLIFFNFTYLSSQEKVNLQDLQPTFEEEIDATDTEKDSQILKIKSRKKMFTFQKGDMVSTYSDSSKIFKKFKYYINSDHYNNIAKFIHWYKGYCSK